MGCAVPEGGWFVPAVEAGIALSIVYAALVALMRRDQPGAGLVTAAIGLLHGLGFSFVLREILRIDSPNLWHSLLAFNVGVEVGQIAIVVLAWSGLRLLARGGPRALVFGRWAVAVPCVCVASLWASQRAVLLASSL